MSHVQKLLKYEELRLQDAIKVSDQHVDGLLQRIESERKRRFEAQLALREVQAQLGDQSEVIADPPTILH